MIVATPEDSVILAPGESYILPEASSPSFTLNLTAGWNMVSLPFLPEDPRAQSVMSEAAFYQLVSWSGTGYVDATEFELGKGLAAGAGGYEHHDNGIISELTKKSELFELIRIS